MAPGIVRLSTIFKMGKPNSGQTDADGDSLGVRRAVWTLLRCTHHFRSGSFTTEAAKADVCTCPLRPESDRLPTNCNPSLRAITGLMHCNKVGKIRQAADPPEGDNLQIR